MLEQYHASFWSKDKAYVIGLADPHCIISFELAVQSEFT